jgi:hypothetical protein
MGQSHNRIKHIRAVNGAGEEGAREAISRGRLVC